MILAILGVAQGITGESVPQTMGRTWGKSIKADDERDQRSLRMALSSEPGLLTDTEESKAGCAPGCRSRIHRRHKQRDAWLGFWNSCWTAGDNIPQA